MRIKEGFILKDVAGSKIVIATGEQKMDFSGVITFNSVGADIFMLLDGTNSIDDIVKKISEDYEAPVEVVQADVEKLIEKMRKYNLIED